MLAGEDGARYTGVMTDALRAKISQKRKRLTALDHERVVLEAELRAYEDALKLIAPGEAGNIADSIGLSNRQRVPRPRRLSDEWSRALAQFVPNHREAFDIDAVLAAANVVGLNPTRGNVRSQMAAYVGRGLLERVNEGSFRLTDAGLSEFSHGQVSGGDPPIAVPSAPDKPVAGSEEPAT